MADGGKERFFSKIRRAKETNCVGVATHLGDFGLGEKRKILS